MLPHVIGVADIAPGVLFPACYDSQEDYEAWLRSAKSAGYKCSPCTDCAPEYQQLMLCENRCDPADVQDRFAVRTAGEKQRRHTRRAA